ncbi:MAG: UDP-N-acetylmuramoyl-L-alanine--D-glutamate ligase, partial [Burkholderiales bacterium]|nr:UDP-N-acetylmuramoyl-L-alanine--D-glutamate ligase [Burkholderiales bacterium]
MNFDGQRVLVLGLGITGLSMARWLSARGACVGIADTREAPPGLDDVRAALPEAQIALGPLRPQSFDGIDLIAISPGVPREEAEVQAALGRGIEVVGDIELFARSLDSLAHGFDRVRPRVLAITGSNGKSTVTEMTGALCRGADLETLVAGNIGLPVLDALTDIEQGRRAFPDVVVLELSSFQLESTSSLRPDAAVVLNVSEDHLDRYPDILAYAAAKARIFRGAAVQIVNRDDPLARRLAQPDAPVWSFGLGMPGGEHVWGLLRNGEDYLAEGATRILPVTRLKLAGLHNAGNALAAMALCRAIGLDYWPLATALEQFEGLPHRVQFVDTIAGRRFYDDSKGTNVGATAAALNGMREPVVLIAGGDGKGQDFTPLAPAVKAHARIVVLIGRDADRIAQALAGTGVPVVRAMDMDSAVRSAFEASERGDSVLLSPACASFDMYRNYQHRAEVFRFAVGRLK